MVRGVGSGSLRYRSLIAAVALVLACAAAARAGTAGDVPPANPSANCDASAAQFDHRAGLGANAIDQCRAREGVGPLVLPRNWHRLTAAQRLFVLVDLERVDRGIAPLPGMVAAVDRTAAAGAEAGGDPPITGANHWGGSVWSGSANPLEAVYLWMYDDGPNGLALNLDCRGAGAPGCWGHRDILLTPRRGPLLAGFAVGPRGAAGEILEPLHPTRPRFTFSWARELRQFARRPGPEPLSAAARR
jgi:hypothetical protein